LFVEWGAVWAMRCCGVFWSISWSWCWHGLHLCLATFSGTALLCRVQVVKWHLALATDVVLLVVVDGEHVDRMVALWLVKLQLTAAWKTTDELISDSIKNLLYIARTESPWKVLYRLEISVLNAHATLLYFLIFRYYLSFSFLKWNPEEMTHACCSIYPSFSMGKVL
jgi:hypothetical protein